MFSRWWANSVACTRSVARVARAARALMALSCSRSSKYCKRISRSAARNASASELRRTASRLREAILLVSACELRILLPGLVDVMLADRALPLLEAVGEDAEFDAFW